MKIIDLKCNNCGADLKINPKIKFFNCGFCYSSLAIKEEGNVIFSELLKSVKKDTNFIKDNSEILLLEKEIARLDRDWSFQREKYKINGQIADGSIIPLIIFPIIGIIIVSIGFNGISNSSHPETALIPFIFIIIIIIASIYNISVSLSYQEAKKKYKKNRAHLLTNLIQKQSINRKKAQ